MTAPARTGGSGGGDGLTMGLMQEPPVNLASILEHAGLYHASQEIVTALPDQIGVIHRQTYADTLARTKQAANAIKRLGIKPGQRVATLAWNTHRHVEAWYAISGQGMVCHTVNPRLIPTQIAYIINHAENQAVLFDVQFTPIFQGLKDKLPTVKHWIALAGPEHTPEGALSYEELIAAEEPVFEWPEFDPHTASSLCYTSGTTGDPKGVLYSHMSNFLQAYAIGQKDIMGCGAEDTILMVVPMFHANSWGMAYGLPMVGSKMVLPGIALDGKSVHGLIKSEQITFSAAVPTVWQMLLAHLEETGQDLKPLKGVMIGGAAVPRAMIDIFHTKYDVEVIHGWGMTEMSPLGSVNRPLARHKDLDHEAYLDLRAKQGRPPFGVAMKIVNEAGEELPRDGKAFGRLLVKGPWVAAKYFKRDEEILDADGWFDTGDIASIDEDGFMSITDRAKDVIKSGGEWISSVDMENAAMAHPDVQMACAIGLPHPKWGERPFLLVVAKEGAEPTAESIKDTLAEAFAKWQLPDEVVFVDELPLGATGKFDKKKLREVYAEQYAGRE